MYDDTTRATDSSPSFLHGHLDCWLLPGGRHPHEGEWVSDGAGGWGQIGRRVAAVVGCIVGAGL